MDGVKRAKKRLGRRIKYLREEACRFTQEDLAERLGVSPVYISRLERGDSSPSFKMLVQIATAFNVSLEELVKMV